MLMENLPVTIAAIVVLGLVYVWRHQTRHGRLPPGPYSKSLFGVAKPIPKDPRGPWFAFDALGKQFGVFHVIM